MRQFLICVACSSAMIAADRGEKPIRHTEIPGMNNFIGLRYLPDDRYSGDSLSLRGDYEMLLSLHVPKEGNGPFPVVIYVHGGAYEGGSKEGQQGIAKELAGRGIAYCGLNYVLRPKGIFPQCWWDFHNALRFLRQNAGKYNVDPLRIGAYGISAGGWLISSASLPNGDYLAAGAGQGLAVHLPTLMAKGKLTPMRRAKKGQEEWEWLKPMRDPAPAWPEEAGGVSALAWDFCYFVNLGDGSAPSIQQWRGVGAGKPAWADQLIAAGVQVSFGDMTHPKVAGKAVHVPAFFNRDSKDSEADALDLDGRPGKTLGVVMVDFFVRELTSPRAKPPAPEIRPVPHLINGPTPVTLLAPRGASVHYTTDGSQPTAASPAYTSPFTVAPGTKVRAISVAPGMQPSGAASAEFVAGNPAPIVTGPASLPPGETGKPYSVTFTANQPTARWSMCGDLQPYIHFQKKDWVIPNGMNVDTTTGIWSGTPTKPGSYWVQVWVAEGPEMLAGYRNYRWTVTGRDLGEPDGLAVDATDRNQTFAILKNWPADQATALLDAFTAAKVRVVSPGKAGEAAQMLVVHADDRAKAEGVLKQFTTAHPGLVVEPIKP